MTKIRVATEKFNNLTSNKNVENNLCINWRIVMPCVENILGQITEQSSSPSVGVEDVPEGSERVPR